MSFMPPCPEDSIAIPAPFPQLCCHLQTPLATLASRITFHWLWYLKMHSVYTWLLPCLTTARVQIGHSTVPVGFTWNQTKFIKAGARKYFARSRMVLWLRLNTGKGASLCLSYPLMYENFMSKVKLAVNRIYSWDPPFGACSVWYHYKGIPQWSFTPTLTLSTRIQSKNNPWLIHTCRSWNSPGMHALQLWFPCMISSFLCAAKCFIWKWLEPANHPHSC